MDSLVSVLQIGKPRPVGQLSGLQSCEKHLVMDLLFAGLKRGCVLCLILLV